MRICVRCKGELYRVHRGLLQRFSYRGVYRCRQCGEEEVIPRRIAYRFGPFARCPRCGNERVSKLRERDRIDKMERGPMNLLARLKGGRIFHCGFCRLQFYDERAPRRQ